MATSKLNPYLNFDGNAREAMEFYKGVFGGNLNVSTFGEAHATEDPNYTNHIMHGQLDTENGFTLMGSDILPGMGSGEFSAGTNFSISLSGDNEAELKGYWDRLAVGSTISVPLEKAPWGDTFGMLNDKFGVGWMVNIAGPKM